MAETTGVEWADATWNWCWGCRKVDKDCKFCYVERVMRRSGRTFNVVQRTADRTFNMPLRLKRPSRVFTLSMGDFFGEETDPWRTAAWEVIRRCPQHAFIIPTKRTERVLDHLPKTCLECGEGIFTTGEHTYHENFLDGDGKAIRQDGGVAALPPAHEARGWPWPHVCIGTSVGHQAAAEKRVPEILRVPSRVRFLSVEPLLEEVNLEAWMPPLGQPRVEWSPDGKTWPTIDWIVCGGESGPPGRARKMRPEWARSVRDQARRADVPFFFKQNGGSSHCDCHGAWGCRKLDGEIYDGLPPYLAEFVARRIVDEAPTTLDSFGGE